MKLKNRISAHRKILNLTLGLKELVKDNGALTIQKVMYPLLLLNQDRACAYLGELFTFLFKKT